MDDEQKKHKEEKLKELIPIFAHASIGDFSKDVPIIDSDDEFAEFYAGVQIMIDVIRDKVGHLEKELAYHEQMQDRLKQSEERFKALIEKSFDAVILTDKAGVITYASPTFTKILGYTIEEVLGKSGSEFIHPDDLQRAITVTSEIIGKPNQSAAVEIRCKHKDGSWKNIEVITTNLLDNPSVNATVSNFHDVTERTIIQETLAREKAEAEAVLANIGDGLIVTDNEGKIELINYAAETMLGWSTKDVTGKKVIEVLPMEDEKIQPVQQEDRPMTKTLTSGQKNSGVFYYKRKDETKFPVSLTVTPLVLSGKIVGAIEVFRDITREKELDKAKDEFISLASHELRTPMTAIKGLLSMIMRGDYGEVNEELKKPLENIHLSSERQIHLINDLLDVSRLQTGKIHFKLTNFVLKPVINEVVESLQPLAKQRNVSLAVKDITDSTVQGDVVWVKQVFNNLIGNALKFTEKGEIAISTRYEENFVLVVVIDTGMGIDPEDQDKLFERFRQLNTTSKKFIGSGLGLYISREVARKMGGNLYLEKSVVGEGSTFVLSIPEAETAYATKVKETIDKEMEIAFGEKTK